MLQIEKKRRSKFILALHDPSHGINFKSIITHSDEN